MKSNKITLKTIADQAQLSTATISMILSNKNLYRFSKETIDKVKLIANNLGYDKDSSQQEIKNIYIICPSIYNPYYATLVQGIEMQAISLGIRTTVVNTYWNIEIEKNTLNHASSNNIS